MKLHKWSNIKQRGMTPGRVERANQAVASELVAMDLRALRDKLGVTQEELANRIKVSQSQLSRLERRKDSRLSTIRRYVEAMGGELEITAVIRGKRVPLVRAMPSRRHAA
jgi:predicted transcriptional regulator